MRSTTSNNLAQSLAGNAARGALYGALFGVVLIGVGLVRALFAMLSGGRVSFARGDLAMLGLYVGSLTFAGAALGAIRIHQRGKPAIALGYMAAGAVVVLALAGGENGGFRGMDGFDWIVYSALGALFGGVLAYGYLKK